jgi:hypothetical protein
MKPNEVSYNSRLIKNFPRIMNHSPMPVTVKDQKLKPRASVIVRVECEHRGENWLKSSLARRLI